MNSLRDTSLETVLAPSAHFRDARTHALPRERLEEVRRRSHRFHELMMERDPVDAYYSRTLVRAPYPVKYALRDVPTLPTPYLHIVNRMFIVQFEKGGRRWTLLVSPSDVEANGATPFFWRLRQSFGPLADRIGEVIAPMGPQVAEQLAEVGLVPEDIDFITYDHLHTQDVRRLLGTRSQPGLLPNAKLLVMRQEWESAKGLLPTQADWYCPGGVDDIDSDRVVLLDGTTFVGDSVALVHTPGHTEGNHSIVVRTPEGVMVTSENGIGPDAYAPFESKIPGVAKYARQTGSEVVLNGNTLERGVDQYISMVQEKTIAGRSERDSRFPNMVCSSEFDAYWLFPGLRPTFKFGDITHGEVRRP